MVGEELLWIDHHITKNPWSSSQQVSDFALASRLDAIKWDFSKGCRIDFLSTDTHLLNTKPSKNSGSWEGSGMRAHSLWSACFVLSYHNSTTWKSGLSSSTGFPAGPSEHEQRQTVIELSCPFTPHVEPPIYPRAGPGQQKQLVPQREPWCTNAAHLQERNTACGEKKKEKKKNKYIFSECLLQDMWRRGHRQASQLFSAAVSSNQAPFTPMSKQISLSGPICTHRTPGLSMWFWQSDWHSFWSRSTSFICLCACWMQSSFMLKIK